MKNYGLILFCFLFFSLVYIHQRNFDGPTSVSRLDLLHAIVGRGTVCIDAYHHNTTDKAMWEGHYYSDKAPGTVVLALPAFLIARLILFILGISLDSGIGWLVSSWIACAGSIALIASAGGVACYYWLRQHVPAQAAITTTLAVYLGGMPLPYSTMMFSHALVVGLLSGALWAVDGPREFPDQRQWDLLGGFCSGWALACEYTAGLVIVGLLVWLYFRSRKRALLFAAAMLPALLLIPAYSWLCFSKPFILPYSLQASFPTMRDGLYAIRWPSARTAANLLFMPTRGLFFWSPFLLLAGLAFFELLRKSRLYLFLVILVPLIQVTVISGRGWDWQAGPAMGPRYLSPILPLLALPCAMSVLKYRSVALYWAGYAIAITVLATITDATPPGRIWNPLFDLNVADLLRGRYSHSIGAALGLPQWLSMLLYGTFLVFGMIWLYRNASDAGKELETGALWRVTANVSNSSLHGPALISATSRTPEATALERSTDSPGRFS